MFLFTFDLSSFLERKNPLRLLRAFQAAFAPDDGVLLVLKCAHPEIAPETWESSCEAARVPNVMIMSDVMPGDEIGALVRACLQHVAGRM